MRYYFAGAYARRAELAAYAERLAAGVHGTSVVSRWLTDPQEGLDAGFSAGNIGSQAAITRAWAYGRRDLEDLSICHVIVSFTGEGTRGGRHIEHGYALAWKWNLTADDDFGRMGMRLVIVGPREHVFHCHPATEQFDTFDEFLKHEIEQYREA